MLRKTTTIMRYSIYSKIAKTLIAKDLNKLRQARASANLRKQIVPEDQLCIYRYDHSDYSKYSEEIEQL